MHNKIEITPYLSQKIKLISLLAIFMVFVQHGSYGLPDTGIRGVFKHIVSLGIADYPVSFFSIVSGFFLSRKFTPTLTWYWNELKKRFFSLLVPYVIYIGIGFWLYDCSSRMTILDGLGITSLTPAVAPLWYVRTLIFLCLLSPMILCVMTLMARYALCRYVGLVIFMVASTIAFPAKTTGMFVLYFSFGTYLAQYGRCLDTVSTKIKFNISFVLLIALLGFKLYYIMNYPCNPEKVFFRCQVIPFTIASIWYGYDLIFKEQVLHIPRWLSFASETTFFVYCTESFLRYGLNIVIIKFGCQAYANTPISIIASSFLIATIALLLAKILQKNIPFLYKMLAGGR